MDLAVLEKLVDDKLSIGKISKYLNVSKGSVKYWLKKYSLKTFIPPKKTEKENRRRSSKSVSDRRRKLKLMSIEYKGGSCVICGYNKCVWALDFHHRNPIEKEFSISHNGLCKSWDRVKKELDKCDLVCRNCHAEIHAEDN